MEVPLIIICSQCHGKKSAVGTTPTLGLNLETATFQAPGDKPASVLCTQCNGLGYMTGGSF